MSLCVFKSMPLSAYAHTRVCLRIYAFSVGLRVWQLEIHLIVLWRMQSPLCCEHDGTFASRTRKQEEITRHFLCWRVCACLAVMPACVALFLCHFGSVWSHLKGLCLLVCACFCSFVDIKYTLKCPTLMCSCVSWLRHYASSFFVCFKPKELVICVLHVAVFFPPSSYLIPFKHFDKFNPSCVDVFGAGKNCFLTVSL